MKYLVLAANILLGFIFTLGGLNGFFSFFELPPMSPAAGNFLEILIQSGFMKVIKGLELALGLMILVGFQRPIAYLMVMPISVGIALFEVFILQVPGIGLLLTLLNAFLIWNKRELYFPMLKLA
jgi:hypothetical protein